MPDQPTYHNKVLDHLGLVSGMFDELGFGEVVRTHISQLQTSYGLTYLVADGASTVKTISTNSPRHR